MKTNLFVLLLLVSSFVFAQSTANYVIATDVRTTPKEIYAGDDVNLTFNLYNLYDYDAEDVVIQLSGSYPLVELSPTQTHRMNSIPSGIGQVGLEPLTFRLHVDPNAPAGTYSVNIEITYSSVTETKLPNGATSTLATVRSDALPISFRVKGAPHISASVLSQGLEPGVKGLLTLSITNDGTDTAKSASVSLESTDIFEVLGTPSTHIGDLDSGRNAQVTFTIRADEKSSSERHDLPITLTYSNKYGKEFKHSEQIPIMVSVYEPLLEVSVSDTTERPRAGDDSAILLEVRNRGDGTAKNARIQVSSAGPIEVKWPTNDISLGDIPAGATKMATVKVKVQEGAPQQEISLPAKLTYWNSNKQKEYDTPDNVPVGLESAANFMISSSSSDLKPNEMWKQVSFVIKNTGNVEAKEVKVIINTQYPITPSGKEQYVASIQPGESKPIAFHVDVDSEAVPQEYPVDVYFEWKEDGDKKYTTSKSHALAISRGEEDFLSYGILAGLALVLVAVFIFRKLGSKK